jgi:hypothetical protein
LPAGDGECFDAPDADSMEEAISKFVEGLDSQERSGFDDIHRLGLPVSLTKAISEASKERAAENRRRCKAGKAGFKVKEVFDSICTDYIPSVYRYLLAYTGISSYIVGLYRYIPIFASHCLNSDLSNSYSRISCNVYGICIHADSSIRNPPKV